MKRLLIVLSTVMLGTVVSAYTPEAGSDVEKNTVGVWAVEPDPDLPNVLIIGDSISIGYTLQVRELLKGKANVFRPHTPNGEKAENCVGTTVGLEKIDEWLGDRKWDVIHFNWGLHDLKHVHPTTGKNSGWFEHPQQAGLKTYKKNLTVLVKRLKKTDAELIFATTTPFADELRNPARRPSDVGKYNEAALKIMKAERVQVNDLYALCCGRLREIQRRNNVHFNDKGKALQAQAVAEAVESALP